MPGFLPGICALFFALENFHKACDFAGFPKLFLIGFALHLRLFIAFGRVFGNFDTMNILFGKLVGNDRAMHFAFPFMLPRPEFFLAFLDMFLNFAFGGFFLFAFLTICLNGIGISIQRFGKGFAVFRRFLVFVGQFITRRRFDVFFGCTFGLGFVFQTFDFIIGNFA